MPNWAIVYTQQNERNCRDFLETFKAVCQKVQIKIGDPKLGVLRNDSVESYVNKLRELNKNPLDMIVIILPSLRQDKYSAVKR